MERDPNYGADRRSLGYFQNHMPVTREIDLIILKGHLLLEEAIDDLIEKFFVSPSNIKKANLRMSQKIEVCAACIGSEFAGMIDAARKLNRIRNRLAHHLTSNDINHMCMDLISSVEKYCDAHNIRPPDRGGSTSLFIHLSVVISFMCGYMTGLHSMNFIRGRSADLSRKE